MPAPLAWETLEEKDEAGGDGGRVNSAASVKEDGGFKKASSATSRRSATLSAKSWPRSAAASKMRKRRKLQRDQFIFDHLWGVPGGLQPEDLILLRILHRRRREWKDLDGGLEGNDGGSEVGESASTVAAAEASPYLVLDQRDIAENRDRCCNQSFGRAAREFAWHSSLHGLKYTVFDRERTVPRVCWGILVFIFFIIAVCISASASRFLYADPQVVIEVEKLGLGAHEIALPGLTLCPPGLGSQNVSAARKNAIEEKLPPMAEMWNEWTRMIRQKFDPSLDPAATNYTWMNDPSPKVRDLMRQVMIDGGLMSLPSCSETVTTCSLEDGSARDCCARSRLVQTESGPCYHIHVPDFHSRSENAESDSGDLKLGYYLEKARADLNLRVELSGTTSGRVGFPVVTANYFGSRYLCGDNWGNNEANVICKSLGYSGGIRHYMDRILTYAPTNILGLKLRCTGDESSIMDCPSDYSSLTGDSLTSCASSASKPAAIICEPASIQLGSNMKTSTRGLPYLTTKLASGAVVQSYICAENFTDADARVFCAMKSWKFGKAISLPNETPSGLIHLSSLGCASDDPHVMDCKHKEEASPSCTKSAAVECSPGFPFTMRMHNNMANIIPPDQVIIGYPVIDTASKPGYICDREIGANVPDLICRSMGYNGGGKKMPRGIYGNPEASGRGRPLFVMRRISCSGSERSVFECDLGAWGDHSDCADTETLAVSCAKDGFADKLKFEAGVAMAGGSIALSAPTSSEIAVLDTAFGLIPACAWGDAEADVLCRQKGFACGMLNRTLQYDLPQSTPGMLTGAYADVTCKNSGQTNDLLACDVRLLTQCPATAAGKAASVWCLASNSEKADLDLCKLLRTQGAAGTDGHIDDEYASSFTVDILIAGKNGTLNACSSADEPTKIYVGDDFDGDAIPMWDHQRADFKVTAAIVNSQDYVKDRVDEEDARGCTEDGPSPSSCRKQCRATLAQSVCGCVPWFLARSVPEAEICSGKGIGCVARLQTAMSVAGQNVTVAESIVQKMEMVVSDVDRLRSKCRCLSPCDRAVDYAVVAVDRTSCSGNRGRVSILLDRRASARYLRRLVSIWEIVLGTVGGILSIFFGFSFIFIFEVVYFFTIRCWANYKDPIFKEKKDEEAEKINGDELRRSASEPDIMFGYSKLTGEIGDPEADLSDSAPNGILKRTQKSGRVSTATGSRAPTAESRAPTAKSKAPSRPPTSTGSRAQTAAGSRPQSTKRAATAGSTGRSQTAKSRAGTAKERAPSGKSKAGSRAGSAATPGARPSTAGTPVAWTNNEVFRD